MVGTPPTWEEQVDRNATITPVGKPNVTLSATLAFVYPENQTSIPLLKPEAHSIIRSHTPPGKMLTPISIETLHSLWSIIAPPTRDTQLWSVFVICYITVAHTDIAADILQPMTKVPMVYH